MYGNFIGDGPPAVLLAQAVRAARRSAVAHRGGRKKEGNNFATGLRPTRLSRTPERQVAFAMLTRQRLGAGSLWAELEEGLVRTVLSHPTQ